MGRRPFTIAAGVSGVLCVAVVVLWLRDGRGLSCVHYVRGTIWIEAGEVFDNLYLLRTEVRTDVDLPPARPDQDGDIPIPNGHSLWDATLLHTPQHKWTFVGGEWVSGRIDYDQLVVSALPPPPNARPYQYLRVRCWLAASVLAIAPLLWLANVMRRHVLRARGRRRTMRVECRACGYDLRASPERCPECGTASVR